MTDQAFPALTGFQVWEFADLVERHDHALRRIALLVEHSRLLTDGDQHDIAEQIWQTFVPFETAGLLPPAGPGVDACVADVLYRLAGHITPAEAVTWARQAWADRVMRVTFHACRIGIVRVTWMPQQGALHLVRQGERLQRMTLSEGRASGVIR